MLGRPHEAESLPELVKRFERFKGGETDEVPNLPFTMLSALPLSAAHWVSIAMTASWQTTRMNLNTFARHKVFEDGGGRCRSQSACKIRPRSPGLVFFLTSY